MPKEDNLEGIGGWLLLPTIGLIFGALIFAAYTIIFLLEIPSDTSDIALISCLAFLSLTILYSRALILEFKKRGNFPKEIVITLWISIPITYFLTLFVGIEDYTEEITNLIEMIAANILWSFYFIKSKRVKNTFYKNTKPLLDKKHIIKIGAISIVISIIFIILSSNINETLFAFNHDFDSNGELEIFFDNISVGFTKNHNLTVEEVDNIPLVVKISGLYENKKFELEYEFPSDYMNYSVINFDVDKESVVDYIWYQEFKSKDPYFIEELHWNHMPLKYDATDCLETFQGKMYKDILAAVDFIDNKTNGIISFEQSPSEEADITFTCDIGGVRRGEFEIGFYTEADALNTYINETNVFEKGTIYIYSTHECLGKRPVLIIHEILHTLGLEHADGTNPRDIMNEFDNGKCDTDISERDLGYLRDIYSKG